jgi:hypothetical protein
MDENLETWMRSLATALIQPWYETQGYIRPSAFIVLDNKLDHINLDFTNTDTRTVSEDVIRRICSNPDFERVLVVSECLLIEIHDQRIFANCNVNINMAAETKISRRKIILFWAEDHAQILIGQCIITHNNADELILKPFEIIEERDVKIDRRYTDYMPRYYFKREHE